VQGEIKEGRGKMESEGEENAKRVMRIAKLKPFHVSSYKPQTTGVRVQAARCKEKHIIPYGLCLAT
jgi:hypothetical protein